ncbi:MAG: SIR2 family protein, partial [Clostridiaceae bacterium]
GLDVDKENDLISLAEYYVTSKRNRVKIDNAISEYFSQPFEPTENHNILAQYPITSYWTTNYDKLLEHTFTQHGLKYSVLTDDASLKQYIDDKSIILNKLHGDVDRPFEAVITKTDYEEFVDKHEILLAKLKGEMCSKTFLFLGYSFSDTDIMHILTRIKLFYKGNAPKNHYGILQRVMKKTDENEADFQYNKRKQEHIIDNLKKYGIQIVLVDDYSEITGMLRNIQHLICEKNVFISGACEQIDLDQDYSRYARILAKWLTENGFKIHTGYGKNIGSEVVSGAFDACEKSKSKIKQFNGSVFIYPFPYQKATSDEERRAIYSEIRKNIVQKAHFSIIINGTKRRVKDSPMEISDGVLEEGRLAIQHGSIVIPIAVTGGAAKIIWNEINDSGSDYSKTIEFQVLANGNTFMEVLDAVKKIVKGASK